MRGALRLTAVDARAQTLGLAPGLTLADARARHPALAVFDHDAAADRHWLNRLAQRCGRYSPLVEPIASDAIVLNVSGVTHLFGGESGLMDRIGDDFSCMGMTFRLAAAATAEAARALARHAARPVTDERAAIHDLPIAALELVPEALLALQRAGLKRVGDVAVRPAATIAARFGAEAVTALLKLTGEVQHPMTPLPYRAPLLFERRFAEPVTHQAMVAETMAMLLHQAVRTLAERGLGGRKFRLMLFRSDGAKHRLDIETGTPTRDPTLVLRLFDERIGALSDPLDPGFGYDRLTLGVTSTQPLLPTQCGLDGEERDEQAIIELIDRLSTRLGSGRLRRLVPHDSHIPEQAQLALPAIANRPPVRWPLASPGDPPARPLFLFDPPQPVEVIAEVPDGPPHRFRWRRKLHEVRLYEGPERIASEWWRRKGGEEEGKGGLTRDYFRIEDVRGRRYWIFRHGLYNEKPDPRWYLHGLFA